MNLKSCHLGSAPFIFGNLARVVLTQAAPSGKPHPNHWIIQWDVSGSMYGAHNQVREDIKKFVDQLPEDSFVSIITFSGHGEAKLIAGPTQCTTPGKAMLSAAVNAARIQSITVFSEGLDLVIKAAKDLAGTKVVNHLVLFTDGCPVPNMWNEATEKSKSITAVRTLSTLDLNLSTIGYGYYYDAQFLEELVNNNGRRGVRRHINDISGFAQVVADIRSAVEKAVPVVATLKAKTNTGVTGVALRSTPEISLVGDKGEIAFSSMVGGEIVLYIALPEGSKELTLDGYVDGEAFSATVKGKDVKPLTAEMAFDAQLVAAAWAFQSNKLDVAGDILRAAGNEPLAIMVESAYTVREKLTIGDEMRQILANSGVKQRYSTKKHIGGGNARCVVNVLRLLLEQNCTVFIPKGTYVRTTATVIESNMRHLPNARVTMTAIQSNDSRYNISMKTRVAVEEKDPNDATGKNWRASERIRNYVVVKDGNLHQETLEAYLTEEAYNRLVEWGVIEAKGKWSEKTVYTLDLSGLPMIINSWANPINLGLIDLMKEEQILEIKQKVANRRLKELRPAGGASYPDRTKLPETDFYQAQCYQYELKGIKAPDEKAFASISNMQASELDALEKLASEVRARLLTIRCIIRLIQFAMDMTGNKHFAGIAATPVPRSKVKVEQLLDLGSWKPEYSGLKLRRITWSEMIGVTGKDEGEESAAAPLAAAA